MIENGQQGIQKKQNGDQGCGEHPGDPGDLSKGLLQGNADGDSRDHLPLLPVKASSRPVFFHQVLGCMLRLTVAAQAALLHAFPFAHKHKKRTAVDIPDHGVLNQILISVQPP